MLGDSWCPCTPWQPQPCSPPCSFTLELHKHVSKDSGFWGDAGDTGQDAGPQSQALEETVVKIMAPRQETGQQVPRDISATEMRLVHLDLKGAAPRVSYLEQVRMPGEGQEVLGRDVRGHRGRARLDLLVVPTGPWGLCHPRWLSPPCPPRRCSPSCPSWEPTASSSSTRTCSPSRASWKSSSPRMRTGERVCAGLAGARCGPGRSRCAGAGRHPPGPVPAITVVRVPGCATSLPRWINICIPIVKPTQAWGGRGYTGRVPEEEEEEGVPPHSALCPGIT